MDKIGNDIHLALPLYIKIESLVNNVKTINNNNISKLNLNPTLINNINYNAQFYIINLDIILEEIRTYINSAIFLSLGLIETEDHNIIYMNKEISIMNGNLEFNNNDIDKLNEEINNLNKLITEHKKKHTSFIYTKQNVNNESFKIIDKFVNYININYYINNNLLTIVIILPLIYLFNLFLYNLTYDIEDKIIPNDKVFSKKLLKDDIFNLNTYINLIDTNKYLNFNDISLKYNDNKDIKKYTITKKTDNNNKNIFIPKLNNEVKEHKLNKNVGLMNYEIVKLLKKSELNNINIFNNNLEKFSLKNQLILKHRNYKKLGNTKYNNNNINLKGYILSIDYDTYDNTMSLNYIKNELYSFEYNNNNLIDYIINNNKQYTVLLGSVTQFKQTIIHNIAGGHRTSIYFDNKKKEISFFDPMYLNYINAYNIFGFNLNCNINYLIIKYFKLYNDFFKNYKIVDYNFNYKIQQKEFVGTHHIKYNLYLDSLKKKYIEWNYGYCGLWNLLTLFLLHINPNLSISNILYFYYNLLNINNINHKYYFIKLLIRSFAFHIEQIIYKNSNIEIQQIDLKKLENINEEIKQFKLDFKNKKPLGFKYNNKLHYNTNNLKNKIETIKNNQLFFNIINRFSNLNIYQYLIVKAFTKDFITIFYNFGNFGNISSEELNSKIADYKALHNKLVFLTL